MSSSAVTVVLRRLSFSAHLAAIVLATVKFGFLPSCCFIALFSLFIDAWSGYSTLWKPCIHTLKYLTQRTSMVYEISCMNPVVPLFRRFWRHSVEKDLFWRICCSFIFLLCSSFGVLLFDGFPADPHGGSFIQWDHHHIYKHVLTCSHRLWKLHWALYELRNLIKLYL